MAERAPTKTAVNRVLKVGAVKIVHRSIKPTPCIVVDGDGFVGKTRRLAADIITQVSLAQGHTSGHPTHMLVIDSVSNPGQLAGVPKMAPGEDHLDVQWVEKGRVATVNLARVFSLKQIVIPSGTNMIIEVYPEQDPEYGPVIGMKFQGAPCVPRRKGKPRKKKAEQPTAEKEKAAAKPTV